MSEPVERDSELLKKLRGIEPIRDGTPFTRSHWHSSYHPQHKPIILVDFDHTITLTCPACPDWDGTYKIQEGVKEALLELQKDFDIIIFSGGGSYIKEYGRIIKEVLDKHEIPYNKILDQKPPAAFIIDDRAVHHRSWFHTLHEIKRRRQQK